MAKQYYMAYHHITKTNIIMITIIKAVALQMHIVTRQNIAVSAIRIFNVESG